MPEAEPTQFIPPMPDPDPAEAPPIPDEPPKIHTPVMPHLADMAEKLKNQLSGPMHMPGEQNSTQQVQAFDPALLALRLEAAKDAEEREERERAEEEAKRKAEAQRREPDRRDDRGRDDRR